MSRIVITPPGRLSLPRWRELWEAREVLYRFGVGYLRWSLRVEAYLLLMRDEYPPFSLDP